MATLLSIAIVKSNPVKQKRKAELQVVKENAISTRNMTGSKKRDTKFRGQKKKS